ncbi:MAG: Hpt domain-containing protein [Paenarthrobacter sp.]
MTHNKRQLPLLDASVLNELREELQNDETIWKAFVRNYHTYLPSRIERLRLTLLAANLESAKDAVLSLRTSSQMIGAKQLAWLAQQIEDALNEDTKGNDATVLPHIAHTRLQQVSICAQQTGQRLHPLLN